VILFFIAVTLAVIAVVAGVASGWIGGGLDAPTSSVPSSGLPVGPVAADAVDHVRFAQALRGYRMDQVDAVLDRMGEALRLRDEEIARLESALTRGDEVSESPSGIDLDAEPLVVAPGAGPKSEAEPTGTGPAVGSNPVAEPTSEQLADSGGSQEQA
jgi:DivIVA domain-containing protein